MGLVFSPGAIWTYCAVSPPGSRTRTSFQFFCPAWAARISDNFHQGLLGATKGEASGLAAQSRVVAAGRRGAGVSVWSDAVIENAAKIASSAARRAICMMPLILLARPEQQVIQRTDLTRKIVF